MASRAIIPLDIPHNYVADNDIDGDEQSGRGIPIRAISRAISVLEAINRHGSLNMTQISLQAQVPYPTACRIVQTLVHEGLIERDSATKRYHPTAKVRGLASGYDESATLTELARPLMEKLTIRVGWPVSLCTHVGDSMVMRASTHAVTSLTFSDYQPGFAVPILESAAGIVHLAYCDKAVQNAITTQLRRFGDNDTRHLVQLAVDGGLLQTVKANGYATRSFNQFTRNPGKTSSIAVPILRGDTIVGTLSLAFFASSVEIRTAIAELLPELRNCAQDIGKLL